MHLKWHFRNEKSTGELNPFRSKSKDNPKGKDAAIELYLSRLEEDILAIDTKLSYNNLTREERDALKSLRDDTSIVIKEADKGSGVVVWDRLDYLEEANKQLQDKDVYEEVSGDFISPLIKTIKNCLAKINRRGDICKETLDYFLVKDPKVGRFYMLPKIHKRLFDVPGRPVISNCGYFTENISAFLDYHLQPLSRAVKSYIKDTNDFLKKLKGLKNLPSDFLLCTVDVVGLYPNIPHDDGLAAVKKALDKRDNQSISSDSILELAECVLKNNIFEHNSKTFKQKQGTAIGTKMAPPYAILFMADLEEQFLDNSPFKPFVWWRYIDDIFMIWQHGEAELQEFLTKLNSCHPTIKFTAEYSPEKINFLDVQVIRHENHLITDLFTKPTDTHQYLHATSCHVFHSKRSIPFSQALRLNRICSEGKFFDNRCNQLEEWLSKRGYSDKMVRNEILRARKFNRNDLLDKEKTERSPPDLVLNITYHPAFSRLKHVLSNIHVLLTPNEEHRNTFCNIPVVGFKKGRSLKDLLVRAKLPELKQGGGKSAGCNRTGCEVCEFLEPTESFTNKEGDKKYTINSSLNCNSKNIVYLIQCKTCGIQYVGSASTKFRSRINNYKSHYRSSFKKRTPQASFHAHFKQEGHKGMEDWNFTLIDQAQDCDSVRRKEAFWQYTLMSFKPNGLNDREVTFDYG